jgi:membrane-bound serine protease (ClpP class)
MQEEPFQTQNRRVIMEFLANPDVAYLLLAGGLVFSVLALVAPGSGILEIFALFLILSSGYMIASVPITIIWWAIPVILAGLLLFFLAVQKPNRLIHLAVSTLALVFGSAYLFQGRNAYTPGVNPILAGVVSILSAGFFWMAGRKVLESRSLQPRDELESLIGKFGQAKTEISQEGSVLVDSELWSAHSKLVIPGGARVRVIGREGFTLEVEAIELPGP